MTITTPAPAPAPAKKQKLPREQDPRNPLTRLGALFDEGTVELISPDDDSGTEHLTPTGYALALSLTNQDHGSAPTSANVGIARLWPSAVPGLPGSVLQRLGRSSRR